MQSYVRSIRVATLQSPIDGVGRAAVLRLDLHLQIQVQVQVRPVVATVHGAAEPQVLVVTGAVATVLLTGIVRQQSLDAFADEGTAADQERPRGEGEDEGESEGGGDRTESGPATGVIYARVSSQQQAEEGKSLDEQVRNLQDIAEDRDIRLVGQAIRDDGETGTDFEREGIRRVARLAHRGEISHVLVDDIDRVGRHMVETIYYLWELNQECGVTVITATDGELDVDTLSDKIQVIFKTLSSELANETRARRAHNTRLHKFVEERNWQTFFRDAPLGYDLAEDGWLTVDGDEAPFVETLFETFLDAGDAAPYARTAERLAEEGLDLDPRKVKHLLQNRVYVGRPTIDTDADISLVDEREGGVSVEDSALQIIDEDIFERGQAKIERVRQRHSNSSEPDDVSDLVDEFGLQAVLESSPCVELRCPDCGGRMVKNGQRTLTDRDVHNYRCRECGRQRKFPNREELAGMEQRGTKLDPGMTT